MENYICKLLEGTAEMSALAAMERARDLDSKFYALVSSAMSGAKHEHPLYERAKEYIAEHQLDFQEENTRHDLYSIALLDEFLEIEAENYCAELRCKLKAVFDSIDLQHLQRDIGRLAGSFSVERLNLLMCQRFLIVTPAAAFAQGLTNSLLSSLTNRDDETSRLAAQLWLDAAAG